ncbi:MAG: malate synthase A [Bacteroidia bacterium]|nr:malate synthase A [Bacteroidia bacterium]
MEGELLFGDKRLKELLAYLVRELGEERRRLLRKRVRYTTHLPAPSLSIRRSEWKVRPIPASLLQRHVEITGPADPKIIINALHSGADTFMADLEDAFTPHWHNQVRGQIALYQAVRGNLSFTSPEGKKYQLDPAHTTLLLVRPRGLHLIERNFRIQGRSIPASFFDTAVFLYHNAELLAACERGPYLYIPKIESAEEARLWEHLLRLCEEFLRLPLGTVRVTVLIETFPAAFQMEEILYELREHIVGLNAGRWDYLFSIIKTLRGKGDFILPEREKLTMEQPFMQAYAQEVVRAAHTRGAMAIGGMSAFIPDRKNPELNARAQAQVEKDKHREMAQGFDGAWVAHPDLVPLVQGIFRTHLQRPNQIEKIPTTSFEPERLLAFPPIEEGIALEGVQKNIQVALLYLSAWLQGQGAVALFHLMEDTATAEISRAQLWQWLHADVPVLVREKKAPISYRLYEELIQEAIHQYSTLLPQSARLLRELVYAQQFPSFLTSYAYQRRYLS